MERALRRPPTDPPVALDPATLTAFFAAVDETTPAFHVFARLIGATGLRRSEAAGLTWDRVDLDAGVVVVDRQMNYTAKTLPAGHRRRPRRNGVCCSPT